jgi:hypothetical protein
LQQVVPPRSISAMASVTPSATNSGPITAPSIGQMWPCSHSISGRSSATPRSSVIGLWVCALTRPGISAASGRDTVSSGLKRARASAIGRMATMAPSRTATGVVMQHHAMRDDRHDVAGFDEQVAGLHVVAFSVHPCPRG